MGSIFVKYYNNYENYGLTLLSDLSFLTLCDMWINECISVFSAF